MNNKNTFPYKTNIIVEKKPLFTPVVGDELVFCVNEDVALTSYNKFVGDGRDPEYQSIEKVMYTDIFKNNDVIGAALYGELYQPTYIGNKRFGFFGRRTRLSDKITEGHFYLYEME